MAKLFRREQHSLFGEILDWMLTPLLLLWPVSLALTWLVAQNIAGRPFDRGLEYNVQPSRSSSRATKRACISTCLCPHAKFCAPTKPT
jgi:hypothetical protein